MIEKTYEINGVKLYATKEIPDTEAAAYVERGQEMYGKYLAAIEATITGDDVCLS